MMGANNQQYDVYIQFNIQEYCTIKNSALVKGDLLVLKCTFAKKWHVVRFIKGMTSGK